MFGAVALAALVIALALPRLLAGPEPTPLVEPRTTGSARTEAAPPPVASSAEDTRRTARLIPPAKLRDEPVSPPQASQQLEPYRIAWPFEITDGLTFGPEGALKTRLVGLEGPSRDAVCNDRNGQPWACGLQARAALNNATRRQNLTCQPIAPPAAGAVPARCTGEIDVARELVLAGFARPTGGDPALDAAAEDARRNERGLWNGSWTIRQAIR